MKETELHHELLLRYLDGNLSPVEEAVVNDLQGRSEKAIELLREADGLEPNNPDINVADDVIAVFQQPRKTLSDFIKQKDWGDGKELRFAFPAVYSAITIHENKVKHMDGNIAILL